MTGIAGTSEARPLTDDFFVAMRPSEAKAYLSFSGDLTPGQSVLHIGWGGHAYDHALLAGRSDGSPLAVTGSIPILGTKSPKLFVGVEPGTAFNVKIPSWADSTPEQHTVDTVSLSVPFPTRGYEMLLSRPAHVEERFRGKMISGRLPTLYILIHGDETLLAVARKVARRPEDPADNGWGLYHTRLENTVRGGLLLLKAAADKLGVDIESEKAVKRRLDTWRSMISEYRVNNDAAVELVDMRHLEYRKMTQPDSEKRARFLGYLAHTLGEAA